MPVKILPFDETAINEFLKTPGIKIQSKHVGQSGEKAGELSTIKSEIAIFYESSQDAAATRDRAVIEEDDQLNRLLEVSKEVVQDQNYAGLKNGTQRRIFLLAKYNLPASEADIVSEILKPEMSVTFFGKKKE